MDHQEAHVFNIDSNKIDEETVRVPQHMHRRHPKLDGIAKEHPDDAKHFFHAISRSLDDAEQILVAGPAMAKLDFVRYVKEHEHPIASHIVGTETVDHPTDGQMVAFAKKYFGMKVRTT